MRGMFLHQPSGLYLTRFRVYDPRTARWLSRDPIGQWDGANPYSYAGNDPVNARDPLGLQTELPPPPGQSPPSSWLFKSVLSGGFAPAVDTLLDAYNTYKKGKAVIDKVDDVANEVLDLKDDWNSPELIDQLDFISQWVHLIPNMPSSVEKIIRKALKTVRDAPGGGQAHARQQDYGSIHSNQQTPEGECPYQ